MFRVIVGLAGGLLVLIVWLSVLRTVFVPRQRPTLAALWATRAVAAGFSATSRRLPRPLGLRLMDLCAPVALFVMVVCWLVAEVAGFALLAGSAHDTSLRALSAAHPFMPNAVGGWAAVVTWLTTALLLSAFTTHLVRVSDAYSRRERLVLHLAGQAVRPLDADTILADYLRTGTRDHLDAAFAEWSGWLADIRGTHIGYPALTFARSAGDLCWLRAAIIVLDAAALTKAIAPDWAPPHTYSLINTGTHCLQRLAAQVGVTLPRAPVSLQGREERAFTATVRCAVNAGLPQEQDGRLAWEAFQNLRTQYAPYAAGIATHLLYDVAVQPRRTRRAIPTRDLGE